MSKNNDFAKDMARLRKKNPVLFYVIIIAAVILIAVERFGGGDTPVITEPLDGLYVHFLDVARIGMILNMKDAYQIEEEYIYAAALLHDIGRWQQYENGEDHALVSAKLAPAILLECGFDKGETDMIVSAIETHRQSERKEEKSLNGLLYRADKLSRACFFCPEEANCNWKNDKKNLAIVW